MPRVRERMIMAYLFRGEPCTGRGCQRRAIKRAATHHGMCASCWLGATETERLLALFDEQSVQIEEDAAARLARHDAFEAYYADHEAQALRDDLDAWGLAA
jgi:hypothetical protein